MKTFNIQYGVGRAKYVVNFHDGEKRHADGSPFFDICIFRNKKCLKECTDELNRNGYKET